MFLRVAQGRDVRWYGLPHHGTVSIGAAAEGDVQIAGHHIAGRHVRLVVGKRIVVEVKHTWGVRIDGALPRPGDRLGALEIGAWRITLEPHPPTGVEPIDEAFLVRIPTNDDRAVYADSLEERGRLAEAALMRGAPAVVAATPPEWRRRALPIAIENCRSEGCPRGWTPDACARCGRAVPLYGNLGEARDHALGGEPVALDPAVRRWPNDLREAVVRRPAIIMGQPR